MRRKSFARVPLSRTFLLASLFRLSSAAAGQRTLPPRWQTGGCRRVAAGGWLQADGWLLADGWLQADGPWQTGRATGAVVMCRIFWLAGAAVRVAGLGWVDFQDGNRLRSR